MDMGTCTCELTKPCRSGVCGEADGEVNLIPFFTTQADSAFNTWAGSL